MDNIKFRHLKQKIIFSVLGLTLVLSLGILALIIYFIFSKGIGVISWEFISSMPQNGMTEGGILPALLGTLYLVVGAIAFSAPGGICCHLYDRIRPQR